MSVFDQRHQHVGTQYNIAGDLVQQPAPLRIPLQRPRQAEHFTGREKELEELVEALQPGQTVTLCGPGGIGKTALAAEAIWRLAPADEPPERLPDGIVFHSFYSQPETLAALEAMARAYGEEPQPDPEAAARRALAGRKALLVLDGAENAEGLGAVLGVAGSCGVLVTSRRRKDATGERLDIGTLPYPEAVALLQKWGGERAENEGSVSRICELVGGLPLAVRLAGRYLAEREEEAADYLAWLQETPLAALDHGERQRESVPVLLERSVEQLSDGGRQALGAVGVLALAPFGREAVAAALEVSTRAAGLPLGELVDYGLLVRDDERYEVSHPLVHTYARERVGIEAEQVTRMAAYYGTFGPHQVEKGPAGLVALDGERAHILAVLAGCVDCEAWKPARALAWGLHGYLEQRGYQRHRITVIELGLVAVRALGQREEEASLLLNLGHTYYEIGRLGQALSCLTKGRSIWRKVGNKQGELHCLISLGNVHRGRGEADRAMRYYKQGLAMARDIGDMTAVGDLMGCLGNTYSETGPTRQAPGYYQQALEIHRQMGDIRLVAKDLGNLGAAYVKLGEWTKARWCEEESLSVMRALGDRGGEAIALDNLGYVQLHAGEVDQAIGNLELAASIAQEIGQRRTEGLALFHLGMARAGLRQFGPAINLVRQAADIFEEIGSPIAKDARHLLTRLQKEDV